MSVKNFKSQVGSGEKRKGWELIRGTKTTLSDNTIISDSRAAQNRCGEFSIYRCIVTHTLSKQLQKHLLCRQIIRVSIMHLSVSLSYQLSAESGSEWYLQLPYVRKTEKGRQCKTVQIHPLENNHIVLQVSRLWFEKVNKEYTETELSACSLKKKIYIYIIIGLKQLDELFSGFIQISQNQSLIYPPSSLSLNWHDQCNGQTVSSCLSGQILAGISYNEDETLWRKSKVWPAETITIVIKHFCR